MPHTRPPEGLPLDDRRCLFPRGLRLARLARWPEVLCLISSRTRHPPALSVPFLLELTATWSAHAHAPPCIHTPAWWCALFHRVLLPRVDAKIDTRMVGSACPSPGGIRALAVTQSTAPGWIPTFKMSSSTKSTGSLMDRSLSSKHLAASRYSNACQLSRTLIVLTQSS
jgi:hypothetical protein